MKIFYFIFLTIFIYAENSNSLLKATSALNAGMYEEALFHSENAIKENPTNPILYQMKALLHEALGQPDEALNAWKNCLKHAKKKKVKKQALNHIEILSEKL